MEDNIDDILNNLSESFFSQYSNIPTNNTTPTNNTSQSQNVNSTPSMRHVNRQLDTIYETMINYNTNMLQYQGNIRDMLRLINMNNTNYQMRINETQPQQARNNFRHYTNATNPSQNRNNSFLFSQWTQPIFNQPGQQILTSAQIQQYTNTFTYSDQSQETLRETRCPISLENFQNGDTLCQIIGCGHAFMRANLLSWFRRSHQCPICRYNVTSNINQQQQNTQNTGPNNGQPTNTQPTNTQPNPNQNLEQELYNLMQGFLDTTIAGLGSTYDISINTIPLTGSYTFTDASQPTENNTTTIDVSNNDSDPIEGDLSVD